MKNQNLNLPTILMAQQTYPQGELISGLTDEQYNAEPGYRSTEIKVAALKSALHWKASRKEQRKDTPAFALGRLIHFAVLEPQRFLDTVVTRPGFGDLRGARAKAELAAWRDSLQPGAVDVSADDMVVVDGILQSARNHSRLPNLLRTGRAEQSLFWQDDAHNLSCKARFDWVASNGTLVDLKTTTDASPESFARDAIKWSYNLSAAHYLEGARVCEVANPDQFIIVAVEKTPPYAIALYVLDDDMLDIGHQWRHHGLATIKQALRTGKYPGYPEEFRVLECPKWAPRPIPFGG